jgi:large subunit ribosomal protein L29
MRIAKLAEMTEDELRREEASLQEQIFRIRFRIGTGNIENPSKLGVTRKDLARVKTLLRERELKLQVSHSSKGSHPEKGAENQGEAK